jgi:hypothetical protein
MSTSLPISDQMNPNSRKNKEQEMERLQQQFDAATGRGLAKKEPWHNEKGLSKATRALLDSLEPEQKKSGSFYKESPEMAARQDQFDAAVKNVPAIGIGTWKAGPVSKRDRLLAWHKSLGTSRAVVDAELKALEEQEARK